MAFFKTAEEKVAIQEEKQHKMLEKYGLESLPKKDVESIQWIMNEIAGTGLMDAGMKLSLSAKPEDIITTSTLRAIMEQNWIIIRLLNDISEKLEK